MKTVVTPHILDPSSELGKWLEMESKMFVAQIRMIIHSALILLHNCDPDEDTDCHDDGGTDENVLEMSCFPF